MVNSIAPWDELGTIFISKFEEKLDNLLLVEQLTTIKRHPNEHISNFNFCFQRTWDRILASIKHSNDHAFLYYLKAFNSDILVMIQSMGGHTFPGALTFLLELKTT